MWNVANWTLVCRKCAGGDPRRYDDDDAYHYYHYYYKAGYTSHNKNFLKVLFGVSKD